MAQFWVQQSQSCPVRVGPSPSTCPCPGQTKGKKSRKIVNGTLKQTLCLPVCMAPVVPTDRALCARAAPSPVLLSLLARQLGTGGRGRKMPRPKLLGVSLVRLMVLEEVDFRRQRRKAALRGRGGQSTGEQQPELLCGPAANPDGEWEQALPDSRSKGNMCWEQCREHAWS